MKSVVMGLCPLSFRSGMAQRLALLCWGHFVVLTFPPGSSLPRGHCTSASGPTPLSATMALKLPMALPWRVRALSIFSILHLYVTKDCSSYCTVGRTACTLVQITSTNLLQHLKKLEMNKNHLFMFGFRTVHDVHNMTQAFYPVFFLK